MAGRTSATGLVQYKCDCKPCIKVRRRQRILSTYDQMPGSFRAKKKLEETKSLIIVTTNGDSSDMQKVQKDRRYPDREGRTGVRTQDFREHDHQSKSHVLITLYNQVVVMSIGCPKYKNLMVGGRLWLVWLVVTTN